MPPSHSPASSQPPKIAVLASDSPEAMKSKQDLENLYETVMPYEAEIVVALGGDGFVLETLHRFMDRETPIYGMNCGTVGFLMNEYKAEGLLERLSSASREVLHPLRMTTRGQDSESTMEAIAINEVSLFRESRQAAKIEIQIDGVTRLESLICDGVLVSTPAGSTAYNLSAHGPIVPLGAALLALTPISAFRPRRWRGALLPNKVEVTFIIHESDKRPVGATADFTEIRNVQEVRVREDSSIRLNLLFDPEQQLAERIVKEQFLT